MEPQKMEKWGTKLTIKFLKKYREHRCLWDFNDPEYKNRVARTKALEDIVASMAINNFDVRSANVKIKALRSTYLHEKRKIRKSTKTGISYRPKLAWYPLADSFLRNYVMEKFCLMGAVLNENENQQQGQINETTKPNEENICNDSNQNFAEPQPPSGTNQQRSQQNSLNSKMRRSPQVQQLFSGQSQSNQFGSSLPLDSSSSPFNKKEKPLTANQMHTGITNFGDIIENCRPNLITCSHQPSAASLSHNRHKDFDEFDAFGTSVAAQMRTLPLDIAYEVQLQIQCLITQTKLKVLGRQTSIIVESNNNHNNANASSSTSSLPSKNWNQTSNMNQNPVGNYPNPCNQEVKMEEDDDVNDVDNQTGNTIENNHQNNDVSNTNHYGNIPDGLQDPETSDVEDYLGLE